MTEGSVQPVRDQTYKTDAGKSRVELIPTYSLLLAGEVFGYGANKYEPWSWMDSAITSERTYGSVLRHLYAFAGGRDIDPESGLPHLGHALTQLMILIEKESEKTGT